MVPPPKISYDGNKIKLRLRLGGVHCWYKRRSTRGKESCGKEMLMVMLTVCYCFRLQ
jgi:hypothetical protein